MHDGLSVKNDIEYSGMHDRLSVENDPKGRAAHDRLSVNNHLRAGVHMTDCQ